MPDFLIAAIESPAPPIIVVPLTAATALATAFVTGGECVHFEDAHRAVPDDGLRVGEQGFVRLDGFRADVEAETVADARVADFQNRGGGMCIEPIGDDVIGGQGEGDVPACGVRFDLSGRVELVAFDQRLADAGIPRAP